MTIVNHPSVADGALNGRNTITDDAERGFWAVCEGELQHRPYLVGLDRTAWPRGAAVDPPESLAIMADPSPVLDGAPGDGTDSSPMPDGAPVQDVGAAKRRGHHSSESPTNAASTLPMPDRASDGSDGGLGASSPTADTTT
ncbi:hypothetical protein Taro_010346 [Colocasia esculenta]|uniref:Uncharacterized protein n=1 Tax=Colocasia esculenta TaxID=4460 RepID=A0A843U6N6_COLES|nr:hypothetical protein [Colocasia esculenta]